ncbi:uncharacterized protein B0J16DRAFT_376329 [Fusarium flagelliforme]|uniref:Uncharacterized protein n=1 Tax=Fusarium flagelliforme TaxID=2675880 RepID=A0A395MZD5_9HYPO|nr:uncharacterized protein B0J16DRAFT_376329 [Fusarium flagelliforme]KAH7173722.1 hypothetical protein B0J16DRAFT_376329 [Fusarium flagelliforme]RFN52589.1 hypothetical protein FIE12Z_3172 [Fusarium flagelliforme]
MPPRHSNIWLPSRRKNPSFNQFSIFSFTGDAADRVFHTLELAQQIVYGLELGDFFRALPITKELWESKVPDRVWIDHLKRLGYPDYVIRNTSHCLRTCCLSISQAAVAIGDGVPPVSKRIKMETIRNKHYLYSKCEQDTEPPFVLQSSDDGETDLYILDGDDLKLIKSDVLAPPFHRMFNGSHILARENNESFVQRKLQDWSLTATYFDQVSSEESYPRRDWHFYDKFVVSTYLLPGDSEEEMNLMIEFWDKQARKRGESIFHVTDLYSENYPNTLPRFEDGSYDMKQLLSPRPWPGCMHYFSDQANHYLTYGNQNSIKSWDVETLEVTFERSLSVEDKKERGCSLAVEDGIIFLRDKSLPEGTTCGWAVNGKRISNTVAERLAPSALDPPEWRRTRIYLRSSDRSPPPC